MNERETLTGQIIGEDMLITLDELCRRCRLQSDEIITMVREGLIDPSGSAPDPRRAREWRFHVSSVRRVRIAVRLQRDLGVNLPGAALALELLDRIEELRRRSGY